MSLDATRLGTDLDIPTDPSGAILVTPTGDIPLLVGLPALQRGVQRRFATEPGALTYRPTYGVGLLQRFGAPNSPAERGRVAERARVSLLEDPRLIDAVVTVTPLTTRSDGYRVGATLTLRDDSKSNVEVLT